MPDYILDAAFVAAGLLLVRQLAVTLPLIHHALLRAMLHGVLGLAVLLMANTAGAPFGLGLGLNALTAPVAAALGAPGVALMWALRYLI